jgi:hypothetical protein
MRHKKIYTMSATTDGVFSNVTQPSGFGANFGVQDILWDSFLSSAMAWLQ